MTAPRIRRLRGLDGQAHWLVLDSSAHTEIKDHVIAGPQVDLMTAPRIRRLRVLAQDLQDRDLDSSAHTEIKASATPLSRLARGQLRAYGD